MKKKLWNKDFILLLQGSGVSMIGDLMYSVAIGYWVYEQTGSSALMGIMSSVSMFVTMFLSPFCGSVVDKCNRKWLIVGIDLMQGVLMLAVGVLAYKNALNVVVVLVVALLAAFGSVFYSPAVRTLMLDIIPRDDMVRGQSLVTGLSSLIDLVGTAFSGAMVAFFGVPLIVVINGLSNIYSAVSELFVDVPRTMHQGTPVTIKGILQDSRSAIGLIFSNPCMRIFVPSALILNLLAAGAFALLLPFCLAKGFSVDMYGYLASVLTVAQLLCVVLLGTVKLKSLTRYWVMVIGFSGAMPLLVAGYLSTEYIPLCVLFFLANFLNSAGNAVFNASMMLAIPEENRSVILGFISSASVGGIALSTVIYGFLGEIFPLHVVFAVGSALSLVPMLYMCLHHDTKEFVLKN